MRTLTSCLDPTKREWIGVYLQAGKIVKEVINM